MGKNSAVFNYGLTGNSTGMYKAGKSGNPKGRPKSLINLAELARAYTKTALATLAQVSKAAKSESARVAASTALLDR